MAAEDETGGNNGTVDIIAIFQLRDAVAFRFYRRLHRYLDLSPDWVASAPFRRHDTQHAVQHELGPALWRASVHLAFVLGRRVGHYLRLDRAASRTQPGRLLGRRHYLRRDLSDGSRLVHCSAAERLARSRCLPGPWHLYRADSQWPVGARHRAVSELAAGIGRPRSVMLTNYRIAPVIA